MTPKQDKSKPRNFLFSLIDVQRNDNFPSHFLKRKSYNSSDPHIPKSSKREHSDPSDDGQQYYIIRKTDSWCLKDVEDEGGERRQLKSTK